MAVKRFLEWIGLKERLHNKAPKVPHVKEGEIWWVSIGENIGSELNGKSYQFSRPMIVLKKLSHSFYYCVPTSTKIKNGSWYVPLRQKEIQMVACLHQSRSIDYRRLYSKLGQLDETDMRRVREQFGKLYL